MIAIILRLFCEYCEAQKDFVLVEEVDGWEVYECPDCHRHKSYKVEFTWPS